MLRINCGLFLGQRENRFLIDAGQNKILIPLTQYQTLHDTLGRKGRPAVKVLWELPIGLSLAVVLVVVLVVLVLSLSTTFSSWLSKSLHSTTFGMFRSHLIQQHSICEHLLFCVATISPATAADTLPTNRLRLAQSTIFIYCGIEILFEIVWAYGSWLSSVVVLPRVARVFASLLR